MVDTVVCVIVAAAAAKEKAIDTGAQVFAFRFNALPDEHAGAFFTDGIGALFWSNLHWLTCSVCLMSTVRYCTNELTISQL